MLLLFWQIRWQSIISWLFLAQIVQTCNELILDRKWRLNEAYLDLKLVHSLWLQSFLMWLGFIKELESILYKNFKSHMDLMWQHLSGSFLQFMKFRFILVLSYFYNFSLQTLWFFIFEYINFTFFFYLNIFLVYKPYNSFYLSVQIFKFFLINFFFVTFF